MGKKDVVNLLKYLTYKIAELFEKIDIYEQFLRMEIVVIKYKKEVIKKKFPTKKNSY